MATRMAAMPRSFIAITVTVTVTTTVTAVVDCFDWKCDEVLVLELQQKYKAKVK
jgi:hypothetical protein